LAIDYNGTTSKLENATASGFDVDAFTILCFALADGQGEGGFGRIFCADEADNAFNMQHQNAANTLRFIYRRSVTSGGWNFPATDGQWNAVALSYDRSSTLNDPVVRVNFASVTVTETDIPDGTATAPNTGYCVGNNTGQTRTWDGGLAYLQFFTSILSADDMDKGLRCPGSVAGALLYLKMEYATDVNDYSGNGLNGTGTSLGTRATSPETCMQQLAAVRQFYESGGMIGRMDL
jgi:hypothetical protein